MSTVRHEDIDAAIIAIKNNPLIYYRLEYEIRQKFSVVCALISNSLFEYNKLSNDLRENHEIALFAIKKSRYRIGLMIPLSIQNDRHFFLELVNEYPYALRYASDAIKNDKEIILIAINSDPDVFDLASYRLRQDIDIVCAAIGKDGKLFRYVELPARNNKYIALCAIENHYKIFKDLPDQLKDDKEIALFAVKKHWKNLEYVSRRLSIDDDIVIAALKQSKQAFKYTELNYYERTMLNRLRRNNFIE